MTTTPMIGCAVAVDTEPVPTASDDLPGVVIHVGIAEREVIHRDGVTGALLAQEVQRVHDEATADDIAFVIVWHEGREDEFAQAALIDGELFCIEVHDGATPAGHCLHADDATTEAVIANLRTWLAGGPVDPSLGWQTINWRS